MKSFQKWIINKRNIVSALTILFCFAISHGQFNQAIKGELKNEQSKNAVQYASIALYNATDSTLITGTISNPDGEFLINPVAKGKYYLKISSMGYKGVIKNMDLINTNNYDAGTILLQEESYNISEVVVAGERIKAKAEVDKTTFFINKKMYDASNTGVDILKHIPGIQVDIMQNISLEGSQNILILVEGKERDRNFVSQINARQIDKVEVVNSPGSKYDANITGVINIILKKEHDSGISGHINAEVPTSKSEVYLFPTYSLNYGFKKLNLYTSYNGELSYFDIIESSNRSFWNNSGKTKLIYIQNVRQKNWSHNFHYGFDYYLNKKNQFNFYALYNQYSREFDGDVEMQTTGSDIGDKYWSSQKEDTDINNMAFYSTNFKHFFSKPNREIAFDLSLGNFNAENTTSYKNDSIAGSYVNNQINTVKPRQNSANIKIDYSSPITEKLKLDAGVKTILQLLQDKKSDKFEYIGNIFAAYGSLNYTESKFSLISGLRAEYSKSGLSNGFNKHIIALLPYFTINYQIIPKKTIKLSYRRSIYRPNLYQLNPYIYLDDPYTNHSGNPGLKPELRNSLFIDYSVMTGNNYISSRLFYNQSVNVVNNLTFINDTSIFETRVHNLGNFHKYGIQFTAALNLHKAIALNPYIRLYGLKSKANTIAQQYNINNKMDIAYESGISAIVTFKNDINASLLFQYNSPKIDMQSKSFSDALYFLQLEKTFKHKFKVGIMSGIPFSKSFTYQGNETEGVDFYSHSKGTIQMSVFPVWFKFSYQFSSGKKINLINRTKEVIDISPKKGF